ncbi:MAG: hypothetical protein R3178_04230, partial [Rhodothermales bacterium]|nr:hypothetical protein [Rhodothermales bacterium]
MSPAVREARQGASRRWSSADWAPLGVTSLVFCTLVVLGAGGLRGTDQYWYVADAARLAAGESAHTNEVFPVSVVGGLDIPRPFVHNGPAQYVVAAVAGWTGAYAAWIILGVLFSVLTALLIAREVAAHTSRRVGSWAGAVFLAFPLTMWQASQPLLEVWLTLLVVSIGVLLAAPGRRPRSWFLATLAAGVLFWSRFTFIPVLFALPIAFAVVNRRDLRRQWLPLFILIAVVAGFVMAEPILFPSHQPFTFGEYVNGTTTWKATDMLFVRPDGAVTFSTIARKALDALVQQFWPDVTASALFYWPFTVAVALLALILLRRSELRRTPWAAVTVFLLLLHLATIVLYRNQFRYMLPVTPALVICLGAWSAGWWRTPLRKTVFATVTIVGICAGTLLMLHSRVGGSEARELRDRLENAYAANLSDDRPVLVQYPRAGGFVHAYVLRPRLV